MESVGAKSASNYPKGRRQIQNSLQPFKGVFKMAIYNVKGNLRSDCIFMEVLACVLIIPCIFGFFSGWIISEQLLGYKLASDIALLCGSWNFQVPMWFFKIKNSFIKEIEKATFDLIKIFVFKKMPPQKVLSLQPSILNWILLRRIWGKI